MHDSTKDPFVQGFNRFYEKKVDFLRCCEEDPQLQGLKVDAARATPACNELAHSLGFMPDHFIRGGSMRPVDGLKRWQSIVEMAFIYADGISHGERQRGGGLLFPIDLPVPRCSNTLGEAARSIPTGDPRAAGELASIATLTKPASLEHAALPANANGPMRRSNTTSLDARMVCE